MSNTVRLGKTELIVNKNGFGALPIQRISDAEAVKILRKAYENGINFFDTARFYTDSEHKIGMALGDVREKVIIASKTMALTGDGLWADLKVSLQELNTDYIDLYQFHNTPFCPVPGGKDGLYDAAMTAKEEGKIRHLGITNHRLAVAQEAIVSGLYETLQFPLSYLSGEKDEALVAQCKAANMGFIAMKALSGGLLQNARAVWAYQNQFDNVVPIWGIQREAELDEFLACAASCPTMDDAAVKQVIEADRQALCGEFCRGCGYCLPCPVGIEINTCARMSLFLQRSPIEPLISPEGQAKMKKVEDCIHCGQCSSRCPYGLDTSALLAKNLEEFQAFLAAR